MSADRMRQTAGRGATTARYLRAAVAMARPYFLAGTVTLYLVGVVAATPTLSDIDVVPAVLGMGIVWAVQLLTHYYNEYHDLETDRNAAPSPVTGGSQALVGTGIPAASARWLGRVALLVAVGLTALLLVVTGGDPLSAGIVATAIVFGWAYSSPPVRLVGRGLGEITVVGLSGVLVPLFGYSLQAGAIGPTLAPILGTLALLTFGLTLSTSLPDIEGDRRTGKLTLATRLGPKRAADLGATAFLLGCGVGTWTIVTILPASGLLGLLVTAAVVLFGRRPFAKARRGDQLAAGRLAILVTAAYGTIAFGIGFVIVLAG